MWKMVRFYFTKRPITKGMFKKMDFILHVVKLISRVVRVVFHQIEKIVFIWKIWMNTCCDFHSCCFYCQVTHDGFTCGKMGLILSIFSYLMNLCLSYPWYELHKWWFYMLQGLIESIWLISVWEGLIYSLDYLIEVLKNAGYRSPHF